MKDRAWIRGRLFSVAVEALEGKGWKVTRVSGFGKSSVRRITKNGKNQLVSIRTTQDTYIAFPRTKDGTQWLTLSDVDVIVATSVDNPANPKFAQVHMIDADDMRDRFDRAYGARLAAGRTIKDGQGVWLSLYEDEGTSPVDLVGAGAGIAHPPIAVVPLGEADTPVAPTKQPKSVSDADEQSLTIAQAKMKLARTFGVDPSSIKITVEV